MGSRWNNFARDNPAQSATGIGESRWSNSRPESSRCRDGRIHIEKINAPLLYKLKGSGPEFGGGIRCAVEQGWLELHESGTYVRLKR